MVSGEVTRVTLARPNSKSLRATIPTGIVKHFNIRKGDLLDWLIETKNGQLIIVVRKLDSLQK